MSKLVKLFFLVALVLFVLPGKVWARDSSTDNLSVNASSSASCQEWVVEANPTPEYLFDRDSHRWVLNSTTGTGSGDWSLWDTQDFTVTAEWKKQKRWQDWWGNWSPWMDFLEGWPQKLVTTQKSEEVTVTKPEDCTVVTPTPTVEPKKDEGRNEDPGVLTYNLNQPPVCADGNTVKLPANPHVLRDGSSAVVNWFETEGNEANVYYKEVGASGWTHAVGDVKVTGGFGSVKVDNLNPDLGYVFGIQQKRGCAGGETVVAVIVDGPATKVFPFSYWLWQ
jgi:hypothetical protein